MGKQRKMPPLIWMLEALTGNRVRLFFSTGRIVEIAAVHAKKAKITDKGLGLDLGDGRDRCAEEIHRLPGKVHAS